MAIYKIMEHLSLNKETYLAIVNDRLVTEDYKAGSGDSVKFIKVVSGG
jgi:sulfur carrier protein ThiS